MIFLSYSLPRNSMLFDYLGRQRAPYWTAAMQYDLGSFLLLQKQKHLCVKQQSYFPLKQNPELIFSLWFNITSIRLGIKVNHLARVNRSRKFGHILSGNCGQNTRAKSIYLKILVRQET